MKRNIKLCVLCGVLAVVVLFFASTPFFADVKSSDEGLTYSDYCSTKGVTDFTYGGRYYQEACTYVDGKEIKGEYFSSLKVNNNGQSCETGDEYNAYFYTVDGINPDFVLVTGGSPDTNDVLRMRSYFSYSNTYKYDADVLESMLNYSKSNCKVAFDNVDITESGELEEIINEIKTSEFVPIRSNIGFINWEHYGEIIADFWVDFDSGFFYRMSLREGGYLIFDGVAGMGIKLSPKTIELLDSIRIE